ncbi:mitochondrial FAD carrier protein flx1 [Ophidiomyces ophidiicola]|nr:mitochondrial FAD carrier protein flx1 [Ophidiomyces ophidiicola]
MGNSLRIVREMAQHEGGGGGGLLRTFYRGLTPNVVGNSISWGLYFLWYSNLKDALQTVRGRGELTSLDYFVASGTAGILTAILTNPIWVIKTRMLSTGAHVAGAYSSMTHGVREIYQTEGARGFYRGMVPALFGVGHGALQFMAYEQLKQYRTRSSSSSSSGTAPLGNMDYVVLSGASKLFAGSVTYPYQVLRARLQTYDAAGTYGGLGDAVAQMWRREGVAGFYKGLGPNLVRVLPSTWVTFLVYENMRAYLGPQGVVSSN